jgi:hypothetical protein
MSTVVLGGMSAGEGGEGNYHNEGVGGRRQSWDDGEY